MIPERFILINAHGQIVGCGSKESMHSERAMLNKYLGLNDKTHGEVCGTHSGYITIPARFRSIYE